jgi:hypothetical protein
VLSALQVALALLLLAVHSEDETIGEEESVVVELGVGVFHGLVASGDSGQKLTTAPKLTLF